MIKTTLSRSFQQHKHLFIICKSAPILQLLAGEYQPLLVRRNPFLFLDLSLHIVNGIRALNLKSEGLSSEFLNKNLHATTEAKHQVKSGLLLDIVINKCAAILKLLPSKDKPLLIMRNTLLMLDLRHHNFTLSMVSVYPNFQPLM